MTEQRTGPNKSEQMFGVISERTRTHFFRSVRVVRNLFPFELPIELTNNECVKRQI